MQGSSVSVYEFGDFLVDPATRLLRRRDGTPVPLTPRVFDTLLFLVEHHGAVLDKERVMEAVWPDSIVEENNLTQNISTLRRILGETPGLHRFIVTVPGRGYRFVAAVSVRDHASVEARPSAAPTDQPSPEPRAEPSDVERVVTASSIRRSSRHLVLGALVILVLGGTFLFLRGQRRLSSPPQPIAPSTSAETISQKSIAVLPFENLSGDAENAYFADGVQDEILTNLAKVADLKVISRMSVTAYKDKSSRNLPEIAKQLGVAHLLEGSVQRAGNRVRVNAQLIATQTGSHEWAETYDRDLADLFAIQSEISAAIAQQLRARISPGEKAAMDQPPTTDLAANALYHQALLIEAKEKFGSRNLQNLREAQRLLEQAIARDRRFTLAYCALGRIHTWLFYGNLDRTPARLEMATEALQNASRLDPEAGEVHRALGYYAYYGFLDYDRARRELDLARGKLPNDGSVCYLRALVGRRQGRWDDAAADAERAAELDPRNVGHAFMAALIYRAQRRYADARRQFDHALTIEPRDIDVRVERAFIAFQERADTGPLRKELSAILAEDPGNAEKIAHEALRCALAERDPAAAARALDAIPVGEANEALAPYAPREWFAGISARTFNRADAARASFTAARATVEKLLPENPPEAWSLLAQMDAALGRNEEALREARRACDAKPLSKDALTGIQLITNLAIVYAWTGDQDRALEQLATSAKLPLGVHYGYLKLDPEWDSLRGNPRFEELIASLAPR